MADDDFVFGLGDFYLCMGAVLADSADGRGGSRAYQPALPPDRPAPASPRVAGRGRGASTH